MSGRVDLYSANPERCSRGRPLKRLLGQILLDGGFITPSELQLALEEQVRTRELLGEILVRMGFLDSRDLDAVLAIQGDLSSLEGAIVAGGPRKLLGDLLLDARRITRHQLDEALLEQRKTGEKLGEIFVRWGYITKAERDAVLAFQNCQTEAHAPQFRLGEILVATGQISRGQLDRCLAKQRETKKRIGEILIESEDIDRSQVEHGLTLQKRIVTAALLAVLAMAGTGNAQESSRPEEPASATIAVTARVKARVSMTVLRQVNKLVITNLDVTRGYVDIPAASQLEVRNNDPKGYLLLFEVADGPIPLIKKIHIRGLRSEVEVSPGNSWVPQPYVRGRQSIELGYRIILHKEACPGTYAWPIFLSVLSI